MLINELDLSIYIRSKIRYDTFITDLTNNKKERTRLINFIFIHCYYVS